MRNLAILISVLFLAACDSNSATIDMDGGIDMDAWVDTDAGTDSSVPSDAGTDSGLDASQADAGIDAGMDAAVDSGVDSGPPPAVCGNGIVEVGEACDSGSSVTSFCTYGQTSCTVCNASCMQVAGITAYCGDGIKNGYEDCDDGNQVGQDGCENTCVLSRWICDDHLTYSTRASCLISGFVEAATPALCDQAQGEYSFDGNSQVIAAINSIQLPLVANGTVYTSMSYNMASDEMRSPYCTGSVVSTSGYMVKARPCYHYGTKPHQYCTFIGQ